MLVVIKAAAINSLQGVYTSVGTPAFKINIMTLKSSDACKEQVSFKKTPSGAYLGTAFSLGVSLLTSLAIFI